MSLFSWLIIGFLGWLFITYFNDYPKKENTIGAKISRLVFTVILGPITFLYILIGIITSKEYRNLIFNKIKNGR